MGYHSSPRARNILELPSTRRKLIYKTSNTSTTNNNNNISTNISSYTSTPNANYSTDTCHSPLLPVCSITNSETSTSLEDTNIDFFSSISLEVPSTNKENTDLAQKQIYEQELASIIKENDNTISALNNKIKLLLSQSLIKEQNLQRQINLYKNQVHHLTKTVTTQHQSISRCYCKLPTYKRLLINNKKCDFYTGVTTIPIFESLHDIVSPLVNRRWRGVRCTSTAIVRNFRKQPKRFGPARKLCSKDEFLLLLMKLRLGLLNQDLSDRFKISVGLTSSIIASWLKAASAILGPMVYVPDKENITSTLPKRFRTMPDMHSILDGTEFFIETPKNLDLQKLTWSEYKHHNTLKSLVCVAPNSTIMFVSQAMVVQYQIKK